MEIITKVYRQQKKHFENDNPRESIPDRIVSISKPYVRPIVRGKEVKNVEFGAKCNNILIDGISFIEKLSINAFNEGTRLEHCIKMHKRLFKVDVKKIGGDTGYAGTTSRNLCKERGIQTSFVNRGRPAAEKQEKDYVRQELARVRPRRWKALLELRKNTTPCDGLRQGRRKRKSCTSSSASIQRTRSIWQRGWLNRNKQRLHRSNQTIKKVESSEENSILIVGQSGENIPKSTDEPAE